MSNQETSRASENLLLGLEEYFKERDIPVSLRILISNLKSAIVIDRVEEILGIEYNLLEINETSQLH